MTGTCPICNKDVRVMGTLDSLGLVSPHGYSSRMGGCEGAGKRAIEFLDDPIKAGLQQLKIGDTIDITHRAYVKKKGRNDFVLYDRGNQERSRWGTASEIADDVQFFVDHGHLPAANGGRW
jgi:hypothetical protein